MLMPPSERARIILAASDAYRPDLLVTAGWALHSREELQWLAAEVADDPRFGTVITEVHHDGRAKRKHVRQHSMWAVHGWGETYRFGRQAFATMAEATEPSGASLGYLLKRLDRRCLAIGDHSIFAMLCGELNIVRGRDQAAFINEEARQAIMAADIVINPTHDRMSNAGTLHAKRRLLSQPHPDGRARASISISNWEACGLNGRVQSPSPTLHTIYVSGEAQPYEELADGAFGFVFRLWKLTL
jgi:hypothetical protein